MKDIKVWDLPVRLFHWSLVVAFAVAFVSGEEEMPIHDYAGYTVLGLVVFRIVWGFVGSRHARFGSFIYSPRAVLRYLRSLFSRNPQHFLGHNPAGGWMVIALLTGLLLSGISGWQLDEAHEQPAASAGAIIAGAADDEHGADGADEHEHAGSPAHEIWEVVHEVATHLTLLLIFVHILGVIATSFLHREPLVRAMITGRKPLRDDADSATPRAR